MHEGLSTSSQTEWLTKYVLTFVIDHCCSLQSSPLPNLSNGSSIFSPASVTTQAVFLELRLGWSSFIPKIYGHHGKNRGTWWCSWLRHCATSRKVVGLIPDDVIGIFH